MTAADSGAQNALTAPLKLLWLVNVPSPYRVAFFNELGAKHDVTVVFERRRSAHRGTTWDNFDARNFRTVFLRGLHYSSSASISPGVLTHLIRRRHHCVIVANFLSATGALAVLFLRTTRRRYYLEGDGGFAGPTTGLRWRLKRFLIRGADGYFSTSSEFDRYFVAYGAPPDRIIRYPFTSIHGHDLRDRPTMPHERAILRARLGITEPQMVLTVGRFVYGKGFDVLLHAAASFSPDVGVYFVGGEPTAEYLRLTARLGLRGVHFVGFKSPENLRNWFDASDVFVLPTRLDNWGLVVNEAMSRGVPVVTTTRCIAGLELVQPGFTGELVPADDASSLAAAIQRLLQDEHVRTTMGVNALGVMRNHTIETMARTHEQALSRALLTPQTTV